MKKAVESRGGGERSIETRRGGCLVVLDDPELAPAATPLPEDAAGGHQAEGGDGRLSDPCAVRGLRFLSGRSGSVLACW